MTFAREAAPARAGAAMAASPSVQFCLPEHERGGDGFEEGTFDKRLQSLYIT